MTHHRKRSTRKLLSIIATVIILILAIVFFARMHRHMDRSRAMKLGYEITDPTALKIDGVVLKKPRVISEFELTDDSSHAFTRHQLDGHWSLVFFGFSHCGYVCPTTLSAMNKMYAQLQAKLPANLLPEVIMISVDPERDSVERMHEYVHSFNPHFIGLRGSLQQTHILAQEMSVVFSKVKSQSQNNYMVNHSAEVMLLDPNGNLRAFFSYPHEPAQMVRDYTAIVHAAIS